MPTPTVIGIFDRAEDAEKVRDELLEAGIARHRIVVTRHDAEDLIVGRVPDPERGQALGSGAACLVSVAARSHVDKRHIAALMRRLGARGTLEGGA